MDCSSTLVNSLGLKHMLEHMCECAPLCTIMVYSSHMPNAKTVRRSVNLPATVAKQVDRIAKRRRLSENRVLLELIENGIAAASERERQFFDLAERFRAAKDPEEIQRLGDEMGRFVFGE
jgi:EAL domain-containing protein (putative c-di-GMP-specific phosphodiesterase class I)